MVLIKQHFHWAHSHPHTTLVVGYFILIWLALTGNEMSTMVIFCAFLQWRWLFKEESKNDKICKRICIIWYRGQKSDEQNDWRPQKGIHILIVVRLVYFECFEMDYYRTDQKLWVWECQQWSFLAISPSILDRFYMTLVYKSVNFSDAWRWSDSRYVWE